jgi:hypothetical protein
MAGLDEAFIKPPDEIRETSITVTNGSSINHQSVTIEKNEERSQSTSSSSSSSSELNNKNGS